MDKNIMLVIIKPNNKDQILIYTFRDINIECIV